jgi:hypothetical protein
MLKHPDCPQCHNEGEYFVAVWLDEPIRVGNIGVPVPVSASFEQKKVFCNCMFGDRLQVIRNRMAHPEYENPFAKMSDAEVLATLDRFSRDRIAMSKEFDID